MVDTGLASAAAVLLGFSFVFYYNWTDQGSADPWEGKHFLVLVPLWLGQVCLGISVLITVRPCSSGARLDWSWKLLAGGMALFFAAYIVHFLVDWRASRNQKGNTRGTPEQYGSPIHLRRTIACTGRLRRR